MSGLDRSPAHYALIGLASAMAYADNTWGEEDLYPVMAHLGLDPNPNWQGTPVPDREEARLAARTALSSITDPEITPRAGRLLEAYLAW